MVVTIVLVHHRIVLGEKQNVAAHRISESLERGEITNIVMIGFEQRGDAVLAHQQLRALEPLAAHALRVKSFLPVGSFGTESELRGILDHEDLHSGE